MKHDFYAPRLKGGGGILFKDSFFDCVSVYLSAEFNFSCDFGAIQSAAVVLAVLRQHHC